MTGTMGWDLPPGVTGREDAFGEQGSYTEERECGHERNVLVYSPAITDELESLAQVFPQTGPLLPSIRKRMSALMSMVRDVEQSAVAESVECPFVGEVEIMCWNLNATWTCPLCGTGHIEELPEPYFDEDAHRDSDLR